MIKRVFLYITMFLFLCGTVYAGKGEEQDFTPPGGKALNAPPPAGFSLMCLVCDKNPPPGIVDACEHGTQGECYADACNEGLECVDYKEAHHGKNIACHYCVTSLTACEKLDHYSTADCNGQCLDGDTCESVEVDKASGGVVPSNQTREKGTTISCFECRSHTIARQQICSADGYFNEPLCDGKCPPEDCEGERIDTMTHQIVTKGEIADNPVQLCYLCHPHETVTQDFCSKDGMWSNSSCEGKCPTNSDCTPLNINTKTHSILGANKTTTDPVQTCYVCEAHKIISQVNMCVQEGYWSDPSCQNQCPEYYRCESITVNNESHQIIGPNQTTSGQLHTCYNCVPYVTPIPQSCKEDGMWDSADCDNQCPQYYQCESATVSNESHQVIQEGRTVSEPVHTCYSCKQHTTVNKISHCSKDGLWDDNSCNGQCPTGTECETVVGAGGQNCYGCKSHAAVAVSKCIVGEEGSCSSNPCPSGQECKTISLKSKGAPADCYMCRESKMVLNLCPPGGKLGQCPADCGSSQDCVQLPGQCYQCKTHSTVNKLTCPEGSVYGTCPSSCPVSQDCETTGYGCVKCSPKTVTETTKKKTCEDMGYYPEGQECFKSCQLLGGECEPKTEDDYHTKCWECHPHQKLDQGWSCSQLDLTDDSTCGGKCTDGATCESMHVDMSTKKLLGDGQTTTNPTKSCYACRTHSIFAQPSCSKYGYYNDNTCGGKCGADDCVYEYIDPSSGSHVPWYHRYGSSAIRCYYCKPDYEEEYHTCHAHDMYYYDDCGEDCPPDACEEYYVSRSSGKEVHHPDNFKDVYICYDCMPFDEYMGYVKHYYYLITVLETPYGRYVLNHTSTDPNVFTPSTVITLAKVDQATGKVPDVSGNMQAITSLVGGFSTGFGPSGLATTGQVSMDQLSGALENSLKSGGDYGANCFDNVLNQANQQAAQAGTATSQNISDGKKNNQDRGSSEKAYSPDQIKSANDAGTPAVSGPILACGTKNGNKVLEVLDGSGNLVGSITQAMLKADPTIILKKLATAQGWTDKLNLKVKMEASQLPENISGQNNHQGEGLPNDPLYPKPKAEKKKGGLFTALFGLGDNTNVPVNADGGMQSQTADMVNNGDGVTDQYYLPLIGYTPLSDPNSAWNAVDATQKNVLVAVVDSGLDLSHPDRPEYIWTDSQRGNHGWNFVDENDDLTDYRGHGTFVAGIIAAQWNNGIGIAGINPGAVIMPVKVVDDKGKTNSLLVYRGINYALDHGAKIINVSLGGVTISKLEQIAIARAHAMGALVVIAAGNTSDDLMNFGPSSSQYALAVGMLDIGGARSLVSSWGANLGLMAPGEKIISLCSKDAKDVLASIKKFGYYKLSGTSFSAPMVTATASLILAKNLQLTGEQITDIIEKTAQPINHNDWDDRTGFGLLNASAALRASVDDHLLVMITNMHYNRDRRDRLTSLDIYGTVKGPYKEMSIEVGRGKQPLGFRRIAGPFSGLYDNQLIARLEIQDVLRGSDEWVLRLKVVDDQGKEHTASTYFTFPKK